MVVLSRTQFRKQKNWILPDVSYVIIQWNQTFAYGKLCSNFFAHHSHHYIWSKLPATQILNIPPSRSMLPSNIYWYFYYLIDSICTIWYKVENICSEIPCLEVSRERRVTCLCRRKYAEVTFFWNRCVRKHSCRTYLENSIRQFFISASFL